MPYVFNCPYCKKLQIIKWLKIGENTVCKECNHEYPVPVHSREFSEDDILAKKHLRYFRLHPDNAKSESENDESNRYYCYFCYNQSYELVSNPIIGSIWSEPKELTMVICTKCRRVEFFQLDREAVEALL